MTKHSTFIYCIFGLVLCALGITIVSDFAIPMDETIMHQLALHTNDFLNGTAEWTKDPSYRFHGPFVEYGILTIQKIFGLNSMPTMVIARHYIIFLFFVLAVLCTGKIVQLLTNSISGSAISMLFITLSPRQFGSAFVNSRDIPFMALFTLSVLLLLTAVQRRSTRWLCLCAVSSAAALATRTMGVFLPCITIVYLLSQRPNVSWMVTVKQIAIYSATFLGCTFLFWPLLWGNPLTLWSALMFSSSFNPISLWYVPYWILITTPVLYLALCIAGCLIVIISFQKKYLPIILWLTVPVATIIVTKAGIYNGWRHLYFLYPTIIIFASVAWVAIRQRRVAIVITGAYVLLVAIGMVKAHPLEYIYFNSLSHSDSIEKDYWGLSTKQALENIMKTDNRLLIGIYATNKIAFYNGYAFYPARMFYEAASDMDAHYIIDTSSDQRYHSVMPRDALHSEIFAGKKVVARIYRSARFNELPKQDIETQQREIANRTRPQWIYGAWTR